MLSPGDRTAIINFDDEAAYRAFRDAAFEHMKTELCYCSTLGECWLYADTIFGNAPNLQALAECPALPDGEAFLE